MLTVVIGVDYSVSEGVVTSDGCSPSNASSCYKIGTWYWTMMTMDFSVIMMIKKKSALKGSTKDRTKRKSVQVDMGKMLLGT